MYTVTTLLCWLSWKPQSLMWWPLEISWVWLQMCGFLDVEHSHHRQRGIQGTAPGINSSTQKHRGYMKVNGRGNKGKGTTRRIKTQCEFGTDSIVRQSKGVIYKLFPLVHPRGQWTQAEGLSLEVCNTICSDKVTVLPYWSRFKIQEGLDLRRPQYSACCEKHPWFNMICVNFKCSSVSPTHPLGAITPQVLTINDREIGNTCSIKW